MLVRCAAEYRHPVLDTFLEDATIVQKSIANFISYLFAKPETSAGDETQTIVEIAKSSHRPEVRRWALTWGTFLGRYSVQSGPAVHDSGTSLVRFARDEVHGTSVALKSMKHKDQFQREILSRFMDKRVLSEEYVVRVLGWHTPHGESLIADDGHQEEAESTTTDAEGYSYIVVLERGERSLHDACAKERISGHDLHAVINIMRAVASCVGYLHDKGRIHGDLKQRNILRVIDDSGGVRWCLCDMDASVNLGRPAGKKTSSAYSPPELAQEKYGRGGSTIASDPSFDVWSFGVVLYEMCTGRTLFAQDINNDELISTMDRVRLCTWHTIADEELDPVFKDVETARTVVDDAKNLIRWCLQGDPSRRPAIAQVLEHRFLSANRKVPAPPFLPIRYHGFLSHAQADASGTVGKLYFEYAQLGLHCWLDMKQANLTLEGMRQGVRDSQVFVLVLSERVLGSWFCQQELLCAIAEGKPIQLILEEEPRFHPFTASHWHHQQESKAEPRTILVKTASGKIEEMTVAVSMDTNEPWQVERGDAQLTRLLCETIDRLLPNAVVFRRRDFEVQAMMRELCRRNGVVLPMLSQRPWPDGTPPKRVFLVCNGDSATEITRALTDAVAQHAEDRVILLRESTDLPKADKILLVLTRGVLSGDSLAQLNDAICQDKEQQQGRIVAVYSERLGWSFGCPEHQGASPEVREWIDNHEATAYRECTDGNAQHEFMAMFNHLLHQLGAMPADVLMTKRGEVPMPLSSLRERLDAAEQRDAHHVATARAQLAAKDAEMQALATAKDAHLAIKEAERQAEMKAKDAKIQELQVQRDTAVVANDAYIPVPKDVYIAALKRMLKQVSKLETGDDAKEKVEPEPEPAPEPELVEGMSAQDASNPTMNPTSVKKPEPSNQPTGDAAAHYVERQLAPEEDVASYLKHQETPKITADMLPSLLPQLPGQVAFLNNDNKRLSSTTWLRKLLSIESNPPIDQVIEAGAVKRLVEILKWQSDMRLQVEAAWALTNITSGTTAHVAAVVDAEAVSVFVMRLSSPVEDVAEQCAWAIGNIAGDSTPYRDVVLRAHALGPLLGLLPQSSRVSTLRTTTWALSNLCRGKPKPDFHLVSPALPCLAELICAVDEEVMTDACWALSYLSDGSNKKVQAVIEAGAVPRLVELLGHTSPSVQTPALRAIGNIVTGEERQTQVVIDCQALPRL